MNPVPPWEQINTNCWVRLGIVVLMVRSMGEKITWEATLPGGAQYMGKAASIEAAMDAADKYARESGLEVDYD